MVMEELMLVNPEGTRRRKKQKALQIIFPKPVRKLRANPEYIDRAKTRGKALVGKTSGKHVAGALGGEIKRLGRCNRQRCCGSRRWNCSQADE